MSKFTRSELKNLVKECLVEILSEGLARPQVAAHPTHGSTAKAQVDRLPSRSASGALNSTVFGQAARSGRSREAYGAPAVRGSSALAESVGSLTGDPVMAQILADTATTTLLEQSQADTDRPGSPSMHESIGAPDEIFSDSAQHWATLAFAAAPKK